MLLQYQTCFLPLAGLAVAGFSLTTLEFAELVCKKTQFYILK